MRLTIGMPVYQQYAETWFTVQSLRLHHNLKDCEILLLDNYGDDQLDKMVKKINDPMVRYVRRNEVNGTEWAKNRVFEHAHGDTVVCIDSHILLGPGSLESIKPTDDLVFGTMVLDDQRNYYTEYLPVWRGHSWGIWGDAKKSQTLPEEPFDIWGMGTGGFYTNRDSWLEFCTRAKGFGGTEGPMFEKYRKAGRRVMCNPKFVWLHYFRPDLTKPPYPLLLIDRVKNYIMGFNELDMDTTPIKEHYGEQLFNNAMKELRGEGNV